MFQVVYAFGEIFVACELSQRVNLAFNECNDTIDHLEWYRFPAKIQQILPIILIYTQQPVELTYFGSTGLNRDRFKRASQINYLRNFLLVKSVDSELYAYFRWSIRHIHILQFLGNFITEEDCPQKTISAPF